MIKAVIFDHDGVIIDNQPAQSQAWISLFREYNIHITDDELSQQIRGRPTLVGLRNFFGDSISNERLQELATRKEEFYKEIFKKDFRVVEGIVSFLGKLKLAHIKLAIATSSSDDLLDFSMRKLNIKHFFDVIVTANQITKSKPDPEIYLLAAKKLQLDPSECVVFEDSFSGVASAKVAGMKVILVMTSHKKEEFPFISTAITNFIEITVEDIRNI